MIWTTPDMTLTIRPLRFDDICSLNDIDPSFHSDAQLTLKRQHQSLQHIAWRLTYEPLNEPFEKGHGYDLQEGELQAIRQRVEAGHCLELIAADGSRIVGLLEVEPGTWRAVGWIWNILIDKRYRGLGLGRQFIELATAWAKEHGLQALVAETQTNNINACHFYAHMGFVASGIDDRYYRYGNNPATAQDVAIFWYLEVAPAAG
jgi:streptothricin acetyltransferase